MNDRISAWHFLPEDGRIQHRNRRIAEVGKTYSCRGPVEICNNGMHGSRRVIDALLYSPGPIVCRVEIWGDVVEQADKLCGRYRHVLGMADATRTLHLFACDVAEKALRDAKVKDNRCWQAIGTKRAWLDGKATDEVLDAARDAALAAARDAARAAARDAAALAAARDAARAAAWAAARDAAWDAARDAALDAARDAAWDKQNTLLTTRIEALLEVVI